MTMPDFELTAPPLSGTNYVTADIDHGTVNLQVGRGFRSMDSAAAKALGEWLLNASDALADAL